MNTHVIECIPVLQETNSTEAGLGNFVLLVGRIEDGPVAPAA